MVIASIYNLYFIIHSIFSLPSGSTSAGHGSLPDGVTQTFIPEEFEPLVVLPELNFVVFH